MWDRKITRRKMLQNSGIALAATGITGMLSCNGNRKDPGSIPTKKEKHPFRISLNTSTIRGYKLPVEEQIALCANAGFEGIELWVSDVEAYIKKGGTPESLAKEINQRGLVLENMIAFSTWIADESERREEALRKIRQDMELTARLGGKYIAAPVQGIKAVQREKLPEYTERYRKVLLAGDETGVTPLLELWGAGPLNQLSDTAAIVIGSGHPRAAMLLDFYHLYRGGNSFESLRQINGSVLPVFHINDYPDSVERTSLTDADRVLPGDGSCPFDKVLPILYETGFCGGFSIELFNKSYWETMDVKTLLKESYDHTKAIITSAL